MRGPAGVAEPCESLRGVLQHERARGTARQARVGERRAERVERRLVVSLPQAKSAQRVEIVSARLGPPRQGPAR